MSGVLEGIARVAVLRGPVEAVRDSALDPATGLLGDARGRKTTRQITVVFAEDWETACAQLGQALPWTLRRANLLVRGVVNPRAAGGRLSIGPAMLAITGETDPCQMMERAQAGLMAALTPDWRGGVTARVLEGGPIRLGDPVRFAG